MIVLKMLIKAPKILVHKYLYIILIIGLSAVTSTSCEQQITSREYEEIVTTSPSDPHDFMKSAPFAGSQQSGLPPSMQIQASKNNQQMQDVLDASVARPSLSWETPQGWSEEKGSGMRLVTFRDQNDSIKCTIVSLGGDAGGLTSNVVRWMKQINVQVSDNEQLSSFLSRQEDIITKGDFSINVIDLTEITKDQAPSMIAAIAELEDMTIFVKMTGNKKDVIANRNQFESLCRSLTL